LVKVGLIRSSKMEPAGAAAGPIMGTGGPPRDRLKAVRGVGGGVSTIVSLLDFDGTRGPE
jgi:hypothetical protein